MRRSTVLLASTLGFVALYGIGLAIVGTTPKPESSGAELVRWFGEHGSHARVSVWLGTLAVALFATFAVLVADRMPRPHREIFLFGAIAFAVETTINSWFLAGLSWHGADLQPATARALFDIASFWGPVLTSTTILILVPVAVLGLRGDGTIPRWVGGLAAVAAVEQTIETVTIMGDRGFTAPGGPMNLQLGAGLCIVAFVCLGVAESRALARGATATGD